MKQFVRSLAYKLTFKKIDERSLAPVHVHVKKQDVSYFNLSTNSVISVRHEGKLYYFRECPRLVAREEYFKNAINSFFDSLDRLGISPTHFKQEIPITLDFSEAAVSSFKAYVEGRSSNAHFIQIISKTDLHSVQYGFSIWDKQIYDQPFFDRFGLDALPEGTNGIAVYFLWCMRSAAASYRTLRAAHGKDYSFFGAVKALSSRIVAEELGLSHMITNLRFCILHIGTEKEIFGILSDAAPGTRMIDCTTEPNGRLQRELMNLNVLDVICFQPDHGPNNYNVHTDEEHCTVCAFDNDNPHTFFPLPTVSRAFVGCSPLIGKNGRVSRPYMDKALAERLSELDIRMLKRRLKPYLNSLQINALVCRIKKLNRAVQKTKKIQDRFLLTAAEWDCQTAQQELGGKYGITYLTKAVKRN